MITFLSLRPNFPAEQLGELPSFFDESDPRSAIEQINAKYQSGWFPMSGLTMNGFVLHYPGDPPFRPAAMARFRNEIILLYDCDIVAVVQRDGSFEAARLS